MSERGSTYACASSPAASVLASVCVFAFGACVCACVCVCASVLVSTGSTNSSSANPPQLVVASLTPASSVNPVGSANTPTVDVLPASVNSVGSADTATDDVRLRSLRTGSLTLVLRALLVGEEGGLCVLLGEAGVLCVLLGVCCSCG